MQVALRQWAVIISVSIFIVWWLAESCCRSTRKTDEWQFMYLHLFPSLLLKENTFEFFLRKENKISDQRSANQKNFKSCFSKALYPLRKGHWGCKGRPCAEAVEWSIRQDWGGNEMLLIWLTTGETVMCDLETMSRKLKMLKEQSITFEC